MRPLLLVCLIAILSGGGACLISRSEQVPTVNPSVGLPVATINDIFSHR